MDTILDNKGKTLKLIEKELKRFEEKLSSAINKYPMQVSNKIIDFIFSKSKKIRPALIILIAKALEYDLPDCVIKLAVSSELIHNATLIHDDIIDNAQIRRGKTSLNVEIGNNLSVLSGDFILAIAMRNLAECENYLIFNVFSEALTKMCIGEIDQNFNINKVISINEYIEKSQYKTAELFSASLESLCILLDIKEKDRIKDFAINFGIAFQIRDDYINIKKTDKLKPCLSDIYNGIYTAPVIFLFEEKDNFYDLPKEEIIKNLENNKKIHEKTLLLIEKYAKKAIASISFIKDNQYKYELIKICENLYKAD